jgi:glutamine amidotransferase
MIGIVDYGAGNVQAFLALYKRLNIEACQIRDKDTLKNATHLILPGVGAFDHAMTLLERSGMKQKLEEMVLVNNVPILGVCVGMQMLASRSDEGELPGLNWIPGQVKEFARHPALQDLPMPHMGWNDVTFTNGHPLFKGFSEDTRFYFLHSYYFEADKNSCVAATANYGIDFDCVISKDNIYGIQCHPEKSHHFGAQFLKNFAEL